MSYSKEIFRGYDIRGFLDEVTEEVAEALGGALVEHLGKTRVLIGRDMRETSPQLLEALVRGVQQSGGTALILGLTNTSVFNYATTSLDNVDVGVMVTASHNPGNYNGMKVLLHEGGSLSGKELYELVLKPRTVSAILGERKEINILEAYQAACTKDLTEDLSALHIVVDYGNGVGALSVQPLLDRLGVKTTVLYKEPDAHFPNHEANPAEEETLRDIKAKILEVGADFGIAFDGDLDRMKLIDEKGESIPSEGLLSLLAADLLPEKEDKAVAITVNMGWGIRDFVKKIGGVVAESKIGRTYVPLVAREHKAVLGGEVSGHVIFADFSYVESIDYAVVRVLQSYKKRGQVFSEMMQEFKGGYVNTGEINIELEEKDALIDALKNKYESTASEVQTLDGVKCTFQNDWWFIIRKSNTEPLVRITIEATSEAFLEEKKREILAFVEDYR